jgi:hypothetical protein
MRGNSLAARFSQSPAQPRSNRRLHRCRHTGRALLHELTRPEQHARVARLFSGLSRRRQVLPTELLAERLRVFRLGEADHEVIAAQEVREGRRRAARNITSLFTGSRMRRCCRSRSTSRRRQRYGLPITRTQVSTSEPIQFRHRGAVPRHGQSRALVEAER